MSSLYSEAGLIADLNREISDLTDRLAAAEAERELYKRAFELATEGGLNVSKPGWGGRNKVSRLSAAQARDLFLKNALDAAKGGEDE